MFRLHAVFALVYILVVDTNVCISGDLTQSWTTPAACVASHYHVGMVLWHIFLSTISDCFFFFPPSSQQSDFSHKIELLFLIS